MRRATLVFLLGLLGAVLAQSQGVVIGFKSADGKISFETGEEFLIAQSKKVKFLPEQTKTVDENAVKRLAKVDLSQAGIIRNDGKGRLIHLNGAGQGRDIVLPENFTLKTPANVADVPGKLALTLVRSRKAKQNDDVPSDTFLVYLSGSSPDQAAFQFVSEDSAFLSPEEQLAAMEGFVSSFKSSEAAKEFRASMQRKLADGLAAFEDGGPDKNLRALQPFASMAKRAFAGDAAIEDLNKRIFDRVNFVDTKIRMLKSLAVLGDWDKLLEAYADFERYQWSFENIVALRKEALGESARVHARRAQGFALRKDHESSIGEASVALSRDPGNKEILKALTSERVLASQIEAQRYEAQHKPLAKGSPQEIQFHQNLAFADRAIQDKDYRKAQDQIRDAESLSPGSPEIQLRQAKMLASQGLLSDAIPILDEYDRRVADPAERQKGQDIRNDILYDLEKKRSDAQREIDALLKDGQYSKVDAVLRSALKLDPHNVDFHYSAGTVAGVLRDPDRAKDLLKTYLDQSNSLDGDPKKRDRAQRVLNAISTPKPAQPSTGSPNWFSGRKLPEGIYYCPESLAFQLPIDTVTGNKVRINFSWDKGRLDSILTTFEDDRGRRAYNALAAPGTADTDTAAPAKAVDDSGAFYFQYFSSGQLRNVRSKRAASPAAAAQDPSVHVSRDDKGRVRMADEDGAPLVVLASNRFVDTGVLGVLEGPVATIVSGSSVFNPFLWDGIHYFSVRYDSAGRVSSAEEWNADNQVRFAWDGDRLTEIRAYHKDSGSPYYRRTITYTGSSISSEDFSVNGRAGHIRYVYQGKGLQQIKIENDGKEWIAKPRS